MQIVLIVILTAICLIVAVIDDRMMIIPDPLNILLGLVGLYGVTTGILTDYMDALLGGLGGALLPFGLRYFYLRWRGLEALGLGDIKFISAAGIWIGVAGIPALLFVASSAGLLYHAVRRRGPNSYDRLERVPFGPFLCFGLVTVVCAQRLFAVPGFM